MNASRCITVYNMTPPYISDGPHVPFHTVLAMPCIKGPITYGAQPCTTQNGEHIGIPSTTKTLSGIVMQNNDLLVLENKRFIVFSPKTESPLTIHQALFPVASTHTMHICEKNTAHPIKIGTTIVTYETSMSKVFTTVSIFLGSVHDKKDPYPIACPRLGPVIAHYDMMFRSMKPVADFKPEQFSWATQPNFHGKERMTIEMSEDQATDCIPVPKSTIGTSKRAVPAMPPLPGPSAAGIQQPPPLPAMPQLAVAQANEEQTAKRMKTGI